MTWANPSFTTKASSISWEASDIDGTPCLVDNDFAGDAINVSGLDTNMQDCTLLSGCNILNWEKASVSFNGGALCSCVDGSYTDGNFRMWLDGSSVKVGMLAA